MRLYCLSEKKYVEVPDSGITYRTTKNGKKQAKAICPNKSCGHKLSSFVSKK